MTPFVIFAIILTVLYVFYYAAIIAMDILVNPNVSKTTEEVIEVDADDEVPSVVVVDPDDATDGENSTTDNEESVDEAPQEKEKTHMFNVDILDELPDIEKDFGARIVSGDMRYDRMKALGISYICVTESATDDGDDDEDEEELEEADMNEIMNAEENVKGGI